MSNPNDPVDKKVPDVSNYKTTHENWSHADSMGTGSYSRRTLGSTDPSTLEEDIAVLKSDSSTEKERIDTIKKFYISAFFPLQQRPAARILSDVLIHDRSGAVREEALNAIIHLGEFDSCLHAFVYAFLHDDDKIVYRLARTHLAKFKGNDFVDKLLRTSKDIGVSESQGQGGPVPEVEDHTPPTQLAAATAAVPADETYAAVANGLEQEIRIVRQGVAARLLPALKDEMRRRDHGTYDQKVELVAWVNTELRRFDMAFRHPKTGEASVFRAKAMEASHPEIGHFQLASRDTDGREKTFSTPNLETLLDKLELIDAPARREALGEWQATVGRQRRGTRRGG